MNTKASCPGPSSMTPPARLFRSLRPRSLAAQRYAAAGAWVTSRLSLDEASTLLALIRHHNDRLQALGGAVAPEAVLDAVLADAEMNPRLATALHRAWTMDLELRKGRAAEH